HALYLTGHEKTRRSFLTERVFCFYAYLMDKVFPFCKQSIQLFHELKNVLDRDWFHMYAPLSSFAKLYGQLPGHLSVFHKNSTLESTGMINNRRLPVSGRSNADSRCLNKRASFWLHKQSGRPESYR